MKTNTANAMNITPQQACPTARISVFKFRTRLLQAILAAAVLSASLFTAKAADAYPPARLTYQGFLVDGNGLPLASAKVENYDVTFRIYDSSQGGTRLWTEQQTVTVDRGNFSVLLGEGTAVGNEPRPNLDSLFTGQSASDRFISITVRGVGGVDAEILPRLRLLPAPYAFLARNATSLVGPSGQTLITVANGTIQTGGGANRGAGAVDLQTTRTENAQVASGSYSVVGGGQNNRASATMSTVNGGNSNSTTGSQSSIGGGHLNRAEALNSTIGGGFNNVASGAGSSIGGGDNNETSGYESHIGGGGGNKATKDRSAVAGGDQNVSSGVNAFVGAGYKNAASQDHAAAVAGDSNTASGYNAFVGTGYKNESSGNSAFVGGGHENKATSDRSTVAGGHLNTASGINSFIGGGYKNEAKGTDNTISGGNINLTEGVRSTVAGGVDNQATKDHAVVGGGHFNRATGINSVVPGGYNNRAEGDHAFAAGRRAKASHSGTFVWADDQDSDWASTGSQQFLIRAGGGVGINTTSPTKALVQIEGSKSFGVNGGHGYLNKVGVVGFFAALNVNYSLYASDRIACPEFNTFSDARSKNVLGRSNADQDLETLMKIEITDYTFRDTVVRGDGRHKKVIAQQVKAAFPQAVSIMADVVPDIYRPAETQGTWVQLATDLKAGEKVRLIADKSSDVLEVLETKAGQFRVAKDFSNASVFVYGREVKDFHTVDYDAIAMLNVSATQKLHRLVQEQRELIDRQQTQIKTLAASKDAQISELRGELDVLKKLVGTLVNNTTVAAKE